MELQIFNIFKTLHIIGFVSWFAGLFYLVRLFVYHMEANGATEVERGILQKQYGVMSQRLYKIICNPAMMITWSGGIAMLCVQPEFLKQGWMHVKLTLVVLLTVYHVLCKKRMQALQNGSNTWDAAKFRVWNEVPTIFLAGIAALAVWQTGINLLYVLAALAGLGVLLLMGIKAYKGGKK